MPRAIRTQTGLFTPDDILAVYRQSTSPHHTNSSCLSIENTTNMGGGLAWELTTLNAALAMAQQLKLKTHLDGARLFNAAIKMNVKPELLTSDFDTVTLCLSKGLGCPIGAVLAFQKKDAIKVRRLKHLFGGAMRQTGMLAAAGIYALEHNIERLRQDHENAEYFSKQINLQVPFIRVECQPFSTNMVFFEWLGKNLSTNQFYEACLNKGIRFSQAGANRFRAVTHLGISSHDIDTVVNALKKLN